MPTINFTIWANDGRNTTTAKVYIRVKPVNEFAPVIHLNDSDVDVTENTNRTFQFKVSTYRVLRKFEDIIQKDTKC